MKINFDVDIDLPDRDKLLSTINHVPGSIHKGGKIEKHKTGVYFQDIPVNPFTNMSTIDHKEAEELGFVKVDFLNVYLYEEIVSEEHLESMMAEPEWELLEYSTVVEQLFHIHDYAQLLKTLKPRSVEQLAMVLAIIRPSKKHLASKSWKEIEQEVWKKPTDGDYYFKKSHSISYSMAIVVHLNLLTARMLNGEYIEVL